MDKPLSRAEKQELVDLLGIPANIFGHIPIMKVSYREACRKYHPDKGGDPEKMQRLNSLWQKMENAIYATRQESTVAEPEASTTRHLIEKWTVKDVLGKQGMHHLIRVYPLCKDYGIKDCVCITCILHRQHLTIKQYLNKQCLLWGQCFCYKCCILWFGLEDRVSSFDWWLDLIKEIEWALLDIDEKTIKPSSK